jgi:mono/diheme cytochrome c family protein
VRAYALEPGFEGIGVIVRILFCCAFAGFAWGSAPPVIAGNSDRGLKLFTEQRCIQCHGVNGHGGKTAPDLGKKVDRGFTPASLAITMWNHAPAMWAVMQAAGIEKPRLAPRDAADLFAFFYSTRYFDKPGDANRGREAFRAHHCAECHGITDSLFAGAPPVARWESLGHPIVLVQQMWNHSAHMRDAFARRKIEWQQLTTTELNDMLAYLRSLPQTAGVSTGFNNTAGDRGQEIFEAKSCVKCHTGALDLGNRLHDLTLTDIAVDMWNHAPKMIQPPPALSQDDIKELLSYLWMRQFIHASGDAGRGKQVFAEKHCMECHAGGAHGAPQLPGQARAYSEVTIMSALWRHGPQMLARMRQAKIGWPRFQDPQQLSDLIAYLNSVQ